MILDELCPPAILYIVFTITHIIIDIFKKLYNLAFIKFVVMIIFTLLLNVLCSQGLTIVSWLLVFLPFIFMTIITSLMLYTFELSPSKGKLDYSVDYPDRDRHKHHNKHHNPDHNHRDRNRDNDDYYSSDSDYDSDGDEPRPYNNRKHNRDQPSKHRHAYPDSDSDSENILPPHVDKHRHHHKHHHKHHNKHHKHHHHHHHHHKHHKHHKHHHNSNDRRKDGVCKQVNFKGGKCKSVGKPCSTKDASCIINNNVYTGCADCGFQPDCECAKK